MTTAAEGLHAAGLALEEDIRKMDAGELRATPEQRAFLMGAKNALLNQKVAESGGFPVDPTAASRQSAPTAQHSRGANGGRPENNGLADDLDGGGPFTETPVELGASTETLLAPAQD